jgi:hypothetical protein
MYFQIPVLKEKLAEREQQLNEIGQKYSLNKQVLTENWHQAVTEVRRQYEAIDSALEVRLLRRKLKIPFLVPPPHINADEFKIKRDDAYHVCFRESVSQSSCTVYLNCNYDGSAAKDDLIHNVYTIV